MSDDPIDNVRDLVTQIMFVVVSPLPNALPVQRPALDRLVARALQPYVGYPNTPNVRDRMAYEAQRVLEAHGVEAVDVRVDVIDAQVWVDWRGRVERLIIDDPWQPAAAEPDLMREWWATDPFSIDGVRTSGKSRGNEWAHLPSVHRAPRVIIAGHELKRGALGQLATRYGGFGKKRPNRNDARRWMREFAPIAAIANDALLEDRRADAIRILTSMVTITDAIALVEPRVEMRTIIHDHSTYHVTTYPRVV